MLSRIFGSSQPAAKEKPTVKDMSEISHEEMLTLARQYFHSTYSLSEADHIFDATRAMLSELSPDDPDFDQKYDAIVFGTTALARAIVDWHADRGPHGYDKTVQELLGMFNVKGFEMMRDSSQDPNLRKLLTGIGAKIQDGSLPFHASYFDSIRFATEHVPMLQRLNVYRPEIVAEEQQLTARETALMKLVASQQEKITSLHQQLDAANTKVKELEPKAAWHDEEQERRRIAEQNAAHEKKHRFGHFRKHH